MYAYRAVLYFILKLPDNDVRRVEDVQYRSQKAPWINHLGVKMAVYLHAFIYFFEEKKMSSFILCPGIEPNYRW